MSIVRSAKSVIKYFLNEFSAIAINNSLFTIKKNIASNHSDKHIISFCLFGSDSKYFANIDSCILSYNSCFPTWKIRIYISSDLPKNVIFRLLDLNCELIVMKGKGVDFRYTFWRFLVLDDEKISFAIIRDIDSIASKREKTMVDQWIVSNLPLHIIRDHPGHVDLIMAGMFGGKFDPNFNIQKAMLRFKKINKLGIDQQFLKSIYTHYFPKILVHDIFLRYANEQPIIIPHNSIDSFIGEINIDHVHKQRDIDALRNFYKRKDHY